MAYVAPSTVTTLQTYTSAAHNIIVNDIIDHETRIATSEAAWTTYTPTWSGITIGNGVIDARYVKVGKSVSFYAKFTLGTTSAVTASIVVTLPVPLRVQAGGSFSGTFVDSGVGFFPVHAYSANTTEIYLYAIATSAAYGSAAGTNGTVPFTWSTNDAAWIGGTYEAA